MAKINTELSIFTWEQERQSRSFKVEAEIIEENWVVSGE